MYRIVSVLLIILIANNINVQGGVANNDLLRIRTVSIDDLRMFIRSSTFKVKVKEDCFNATGSNDAYKNLKIAIEKFIPRFTEASNVTSINIDFYESKTEMNELIQKFCKNHQPILTAIIDLAKSTLPCLNKTVDHENFANATNLFNKYLSFLCEKDAERVINLINDDGITCIMSKAPTIQTFFMEFAAKYQNATSEQLKAIQGSCDIAKEIEHAVISELEKCDKPAAANFVAATFEFAENEKPCKQLGISSVASNKI